MLKSLTTAAAVALSAAAFVAAPAVASADAPQGSTANSGVSTVTTANSAFGPISPDVSAPDDPCESGDVCMERPVPYADYGFHGTGTISLDFPDVTAVSCGNWSAQWEYSNNGGGAAACSPGVTATANDYSALPNWTVTSLHIS